MILKEGFGVHEKDEVLDKSVSGKTIQDHINNKIATIGENISLRRVTSLKGDNIYSYVHNSVSNDCGKIGVLVSLEGKKDVDFGKKLAMHIAATAPLAMSEKDISEDIVNREKKSLANSFFQKENLQILQRKFFQVNLKSFTKKTPCLTKNLLWILIVQ